ncbi:hypothetical protein DWW24_17380 [Odoribacter splanchnicus]|uniref:Uncharacterized protein n=1 Tax=Odoribacter splanchnicus TaxID=28118 RepID=A0A412W6N3_9BACT|nr:hypothetical protein DWW24_17380 [Odoribacter splanchnicus]
MDTKNKSQEKECNHEWITFPTFKKCSKCGEIIMGQKFYQVNGIISEFDDNSLEEFPEDEEEHKDALL